MVLQARLICVLSRPKLLSTLSVYPRRTKFTKTLPTLVSERQKLQIDWVISFGPIACLSGVTRFDASLALQQRSSFALWLLVVPSSMR